MNNISPDALHLYESRIKELEEALDRYMAAVARMNAAMRDGINVHGALSALIGEEENARSTLNNKPQEVGRE